MYPSSFKNFFSFYSSNILKFFMNVQSWEIRKKKILMVGDKNWAGDIAYPLQIQKTIKVCKKLKYANRAKGLEVWKLERKKEACFTSESFLVVIGIIKLI